MKKTGLLGARRPVEWIQLSGRRKAVLKLVFVVEPLLIFFICIIFFPLLEFFLVIPLIFGGGLFRGGVGVAAGVWIQLHGCGGTITFVEKDTIRVMTLNSGHAAPPRFGAV
jgi:hypothetical protein